MLKVVEDSKVVRPLEQRDEIKKGGLTPAAQSREEGSTILLGLKGNEVERVVEEERGIIAEVRSVEAEELKCPRCGSSRLYRHGPGRRRRRLHSWTYGRRVHLEFNHQRCRCRGCGRSFNGGIGLLRPYARITKQAETEALWQLGDRSFSQVRRELGIGCGTLRRLLEKEIDEEIFGSLLTAFILN